MSFFKKKSVQEENIKDKKIENTEDIKEENTENKKIKKAKDKKIKKEKTIDEKVQKNKDLKYKYTQEDKNEIIKFFIPIAATLVLLIFVKMVDKIILGPGASKIAEQNAQINELKTSVDLISNQYKDAMHLLDSDNQNNYYNGNTTKDDEVAIEFFKHICTWDNSSSYMALRQEMFDLGYTSESTLMTALLPNPHTRYDESTGETIYIMDINGDNLKFESLKSYPIYSNNAKGEYSGILTVSSVDKSADGMNEEYFGYVYVNYVIEDGECKNVGAEALIKQ